MHGVADACALELTDLGNSLRQSGRTEEALVCYGAVLARAPRFAPAHYNFAKALSDFGKLEESAEAYRRAVNLNPCFAEAWNSLGIIQWELGERDRAEASLRTAIRLRPDMPQPYFNLHSVLLSQADLRPAIECLRRLVALRPDDAEGHGHLGMLLDYVGDPAAAAPHLALAARGPAHSRACAESWEHIKSFASPLPKMVGSPRDAFELGMAHACASGLVLEFGVRFGTSIRQIARLAPQAVHGFDSFEGLPEAWHGEAAGSYSTLGAIPEVPANVILHKGWFDQTLPVFLANESALVRFMNIDCDLYSSTRTILELLAPRIAEGTVMVFDEYFGHEHWREDEFKAFQEAAAANGWQYRYIGFSLCTRQAVIRVESARAEACACHPVTGQNCAGPVPS